MKTILVDAVHALIVEKKDGFGVFKEMHDVLEIFKNQKTPPESGVFLLPSPEKSVILYI